MKIILHSLICLVMIQSSYPAHSRPREKAPALAIVEAARAQIGVTRGYNPAYVALEYPLGDIAETRGVCTDVVVRALRAVGVDLQELIHLDMKDSFRSYPQLWADRRPDPNIDHRRVPNIAKFFERKGKVLPLTSDKENFLPGDLLVTRLPGGLIHIMVVSDRKTLFGRPLVIHNAGSGTVEEDALFEYANEGHLRWFPAPASSRAQNTFNTAH